MSDGEGGGRSSMNSKREDGSRVRIFLFHKISRHAC